MKKTALIAISAAACCALALTATESVLISKIDGITHAAAVSEIADIAFSADETEMTITATSGTSITLPVDSLDQVTFADIDKAVTIAYDGTDATIVNPYAFEGVSVTKEGAHVVVNSTYDGEVEYRLSGTSTDGCFKIYTSKKFILTLNSVSLTNASGAAINCQSSKKMTLTLPAGSSSSLCDASKYTTVGSEDMKGTVFSEGKINITGSGSLTVTGIKKHGIVADDEIVVDGGSITMTSVASDAFHSKDLFELNDGTLTLAATSDGIDGDEGPVVINGGTLSVTVAENTTKGIKSDSTITMTGGTVSIVCTGAVEVTSGDPSYCTAIKSDMDFTMTGGSLTITSSGEAGKGISADGDVTISGGTVDISTSGAGATYTNTESVTDSYSAHCIKADGDILLLGGDITLKSTGSAGKCAAADGTLVIGDGTATPTITASTSGAQFLVSGDDYANPKVLKGDGGIKINSGNITLTSSQEGGDALDSNSTLVITGGTLSATTYDDCLNAAATVVITGGNLTLAVSGDTKKGIKSDGNINISGGTIGITCTGGVVITSGDPSYCTAIKSDSTTTVSGGEITITNSGAGGKGISADVDVTVSGGTLTITTTGAGAKYTNSSNQTDSYTAHCVKADGDIKLLDGTMTFKSTGTGGKCASADGQIIIGDGTATPVISATTTGARFTVSGSGENADYANPKAFKATGNLTVNSGDITISCAQDGGEGLESKATLTINDGTIYIVTVDDAINAGSMIQINGGTIFAHGTGNDGIDSNGDMCIAGGVVIAVGTTSPEGGFDGDEGTFYVTGGILIGLGGSHTTPSTSKSTQRTVIYSSTSSISANQLLHIQDGSGNDLVTFASPQAYSSGAAQFFFSSPDLTTSTTYYIYSGGSVSGGTTFGGYTTGGTYSSGSQVATFTCNSMVTTVTQSSGGTTGPGGNNPGGSGGSNRP